MASDRSVSGKFAYELPDNVSAVYEMSLNDFDWENKRHKGRRTRLSTREYEVLHSQVMNRAIDWEVIFDLFQKGRFSIKDLLMGATFLNIVKDVYNRRYPEIVLSD